MNFYVDAVVLLVVDCGRNSAEKEVVESPSPRRRCCQKRSANDRKPLALAATSYRPHQRPFDVAAQQQLRLLCLLLDYFRLVLLLVSLDVHLLQSEAAAFFVLFPLAQMTYSSMNNVLVDKAVVVLVVAAWSSSLLVVVVDPDLDLLP